MYLSFSAIRHYKEKDWDLNFFFFLGGGNVMRNSQTHFKVQFYQVKPPTSLQNKSGSAAPLATSESSGGPTRATTSADEDDDEVKNIDQV